MPGHITKEGFGCQDHFHLWPPRNYFEIIMKSSLHVLIFTRPQIYKRKICQSVHLFVCTSSLQDFQSLPFISTIKRAYIGHLYYHPRITPYSTDDIRYHLAMKRQIHIGSETQCVLYFQKKMFRGFKYDIGHHMVMTKCFKGSKTRVFEDIKCDLFMSPIPVSHVHVPHI